VGEAPREVVERIRREIGVGKGSRVYLDYVQALKLVTQVVFTRSAGFVLELIQNAEDAGRGRGEAGRFEIRVDHERVKITHNGRLFEAGDVEALCGIRSSKKPEQGTLGYLGIGFKSVFKIADCPEIYSGGYHFKFDKHHHEWKGASGGVPWQVTPIWIDKPTEAVDDWRTTFILPFREKGAYKGLVEELKRLDTGLFLFLTWLKSIRMVNEETGGAQTLEQVEPTGDGVTVLRQGPKVQRFKVFRKVVSVPEWVALDDLTDSCRRGVRQREIAIAFGVDEEGDLDASAAGVSFGGVYSFMPLGEARSGARFRIQADFLVQPGRDALNVEAKWNQWLVDEVAGLCLDALDFFAGHEKWRYQFLPVFQFNKMPGAEAYDTLFGPRLVEPVEKEVRNRSCLPVAGGGLARVDEVVRVTEEEDALLGLAVLGVVAEGEAAAALGGAAGLKPLDPRVVVPRSVKIPQASRWTLLRNEALLRQKATSADGPEWFRRLYLWMEEHPWHEPTAQGGRSKLEKRYHQEAIVLASDLSLHRGGDVLLPAGLVNSPLLTRIVETEAGDRAICHPRLFEGSPLGEIGAPGKLFGFLCGSCGVQKLDATMVCQGWLLPRIRAAALQPEPAVLLEYTRTCKQTLGTVSGVVNEIWVFTKEGGIRPAREVLFSTEYRPPQLWEPLAPYLPSAAFLSPVYLEGVSDPDGFAEWRQFFSSAGVKSAPDNGVEEVAINIAQEVLSRSLGRVTSVQMRNLGYDLEVETPTGEILRVEVKGLATSDDAELTPNETRVADRLREKYILCVVAPIPTRPHVHLLPDPAAPGRGAKYALKVPASVWLEARVPISDLKSTS